MIGEVLYRSFTITTQVSDLHADNTDFVAEGPDDGEPPIRLASASLDDMIEGIDNLLGMTDGAFCVATIEARKPAWYRAWEDAGFFGRAWIPSTSLAKAFGSTTRELIRLAKPIDRPMSILGGLSVLWPMLDTSAAPGLIEFGLAATGVL